MMLSLKVLSGTDNPFCVLPLILLSKVLLFAKSFGINFFRWRILHKEESYTGRPYC